MMDYPYLALSLANLSGIPVRLYENNHFLELYHSAKFKPDLAIIHEKNIFMNSENVSYYMTEDFLFFGLLRLRDTPYEMVLGPVLQFPADKHTVRQILYRIGESPSRNGELQNYLLSIPNYPLRNFLQILCTISYCLNGEKISVADLLSEELRANSDETEADISSRAESSEEFSGNSPWDLERDMLALIECGRPDELKKLYQLPAGGRAGKMAQETLRQQKNLVIVTATLASRAAIRGGLDTRTAFALSDLYIQKAELLEKYESLAGLNVQMTLDFANRVSELRCGDSGRKIIRDTRNYILSHLHEKISTGDIAAATGKNRTWLCTLFRNETGMTISEYITRTKLEEAKRLLRVTDKPLAEIASYLGFSSQSYFQNVFRKYEGTTPYAYRKAEST